jgi:metastasis-associated protein MTA
MSAAAAFIIFFLFLRAVDEASTLKQPSLHMSAAAASRDITLFHAMDLLHASGYDFARGALALVDHGAPRSANPFVMIFIR